MDAFLVDEPDSDEDDSDEDDSEEDEEDDGELASDDSDDRWDESVLRA